MHKACQSPKPTREYNNSWIINTEGCDFEATGYSGYLDYYRPKFENDCNRFSPYTEEICVD